MVWCGIIWNFNESSRGSHKGGPWTKPSEQHCSRAGSVGWGAVQTLANVGWHVALNTEGAVRGKSVLGGACGAHQRGWHMRLWVGGRKGVGKRKASLSWELPSLPVSSGKPRVPRPRPHIALSALLYSKHLTRVQNSGVFLNKEIWFSACENTVKSHGPLTWG